MANRLKQLAQEVRALEEKMKKDGQTALHEAFREFFDTNPQAKAIVWTQYTPWFNDGDACTFGVHAMELKLHEQISDDDEYDLTDVDYSYGDACGATILRGLDDTQENRSSNDKYYNGKRKLRALTSEETKLCDDFEELCESCDGLDDALRLTFGDHVKVVATKDGFDIDEYEHD